MEGQLSFGFWIGGFGLLDEGIEMPQHCEDVSIPQNIKEFLYVRHVPHQPTNVGTESGLLWLVDMWLSGSGL